MSEDEVKQMLRDAIDKDPEGTVWHVNTKHLVTFAQMVADKTKRELESSPEEFSSWVKFYEDRIEHLDKMLVKFMDMNRVLMGKLSKEKQESKENQEEWEAYLYEQGESKEDQRKADEADWADARIACAAIRDAELDAARDDAALVTAAYSNYVASCVAIDDAARVGARAYCTEEEEPMTRMKALRLAAGLTQQELSVATGIYPGKITDVERDIRALNKDQWDRIQLVCDDRIRMFKRDAGLTIKLG